MREKSRIINTTDSWSETKIANRIVEMLNSIFDNTETVKGKTKITVTVTKLSGKKKTKRFDKNDVII